MCGSIRICTTPERLDEAKYQMQRHGWMKSPQRIITTEEVTKVHPLLNVDDVLGALYFPGKESLSSIDALFSIPLVTRLCGSRFSMLWGVLTWRRHMMVSFESLLQFPVWPLAFAFSSLYLAWCNSKRPLWYNHRRPRLCWSEFVRL